MSILQKTNRGWLSEARPLPLEASESMHDDANQIRPPGPHSHIIGRVGQDYA